MGRGRPAVLPRRSSHTMLGASAVTLYHLTTVQRFFVRVRDSYTLSCVSLLNMNKTVAEHGRFYPFAAIYAVTESLSRPILRTYSAEVTSQASNLPHHRTCAHTGARLLYNTWRMKVKAFLLYFFTIPTPPCVESLVDISGAFCYNTIVCRGGHTGGILSRSAPVGGRTSWTMPDCCP